ncbi:MAG: hypothetical protein C4575_14080 [Desulforudis sp.]|jgi:hypothetical protein|nr:MAG: hypothetical protein C4575_14080 [Desulforudis sp.]
MNQGHSRSTVKQKSKGQQFLKDTAKTRGKRTDIIHTREMVFSLSPYLLKAFIDLHDLFDKDEFDVDVPQEEKSADGESDQEADTAALDYEILFNDVSLFVDSAALLTNTVYAVTVAPAANGGYRCWFEEPSWFASRLSPDIQTYVKKLKTFLDALAQWLETEKQAFLQKPSPVNFVLGEADFVENPVVLQKGLLQRINKRIVDELPFSTKDKYEETVWTEKGKTFPSWSELDETQFSRLLDKIWLLWPEWNMPLSNIFSSSFHVPWLVEVGTTIYRGDGEQVLKPELDYPDFGHDDLARIKRKEFSELLPEEKLHLLCANFKKGVDIAKLAKRGIYKRITMKNNG